MLSLTRPQPPGRWPCAWPSGIPRTGAHRVVREHVRVLGQLEADVGEPGADRVQVLADHRASHRVDGEVAVLMRLGVLPDPAAADHDVVERDVEDAVSRSMSRTCSAHSSPRRAPVIAASHRYSAISGCALRPSAITLATSSGAVAGSGRRGPRRLGRLRRVPGDPLPAFRCGKGAGQDAVDVPDRLRRQRPAHVRLASRTLAVMVPAVRSPAARRSTTTSPATTAVRPCRRTTSPSSARTARACCNVATLTP